MVSTSLGALLSFFLCLFVTAVLLILCPNLDMNLNYRIHYSEQIPCYCRLWRYKVNNLNQWQNSRKYALFIAYFLPMSTLYVLFNLFASSRSFCHSISCFHKTASLCLLILRLRWKWLQEAWRNSWSLKSDSLYWKRLLECVAVKTVKEVQLKLWVWCTGDKIASSEDYQFKHCLILNRMTLK